MMEAVAALCPHIKKVQFGCAFPWNHPNLPKAEQLRSILMSSSVSWSNVFIYTSIDCAQLFTGLLKSFLFNTQIKVDSIGMDRVPADYRLVVLQCLGGAKLRKLSLNYQCLNVDPVTELLPLTGLECFQLMEGCTLVPISNEAEFVDRVPQDILADCDNRFLLKLNSLTNNRTCCLGRVCSSAIDRF